MRKWRITLRDGETMTAGGVSITDTLFALSFVLVNLGRDIVDVVGIVEDTQSDGSGTDEEGTEVTPVVKDGRTMFLLRGGRG